MHIQTQVLPTVYLFMVDPEDATPKEKSKREKEKNPPKWHSDLESFEGEINARLDKEKLPSMAVLFPLRWRQFHAVAMEQLGGLRKKAGFTPPALNSASCMGRVAGPTKEKSLKEFGRPLL